MIPQQILSAREKALALIAATLLVVLVFVGYSKTVGRNLQAAAVTHDLSAAEGGH